MIITQPCSNWGFIIGIYRVYHYFVMMLNISARVLPEVLVIETQIIYVIVKSFGLSSIDPYQVRGTLGDHFSSQHGLRPDWKTGRVVNNGISLNRFKQPSGFFCPGTNVGFPRAHRAWTDGLQLRVSKAGIYFPCPSKRCLQTFSNHVFDGFPLWNSLFHLLDDLLG